MYCENCGTKIEEADKFCEKCGNKNPNVVTESRVIEVEERIDHNQEKKDGPPKKSKKKLLFGAIALIAVIFGVVSISGIPGYGEQDGRTPDKDFPIVNNAAVSSKTFDFKVDRAWATDIIKCPESVQEYFESEYLSPMDDNAIFYIIEYTFTNTSNQSIDERPVVQLVDSGGVVYNRDEDASAYARQGGTSPDYSVYDEGVLLSEPMGPGLSVKGQCTFVIAKSRLDENGYIVCSRLQLSDNNTVEWLTGFNFGAKEEAMVSLGGVSNNSGQESKADIQKEDGLIKEDNNSKPMQTETVEKQVTAEQSQETYVTTAEAASEYISEYILPESNTRAITDAEISALTPEQLRLAVNEIYARHGRKFNDSELQAWFNAKSWYSGTVAPENFSESVLSQVEKDNVAILSAARDGKVSGSKFTAGWVYGEYELISNGFGAIAEIGYSGDEFDYISLSGCTSDGRYAGGFEGEFMPLYKDYLCTAYDDYGDWIEFKYNGIDTIEIVNSSGNFGGVGFPGFDGIYKKTKDRPMS